MTRFDLTRGHTSWSSDEVFFGAGELFDVVLGETGRSVPRGLLRVRIVEVGDSSRVGETDFPGGRLGCWTGLSLLRFRCDVM